MLLETGWVSHQKGKGRNKEVMVSTSILGVQKERKKVKEEYI